MSQQRPPRRQNPHFFSREPDGGVRIRIRLDGERAALIETAAGITPLMEWIYSALDKQAREDIQNADAPMIPPPQ